MSTTPRPKSVALLFLLGTFLAGAAIGVAADRAFSGDRRGYTRRYDQRGMRTELARELRLDSAQRRVVDSILDWRGDRYREIMAEMRPRLDAARDSARVLIRQHLDSAQQVDLQRLIDRTSARLAARRGPSATRTR